MQEDFTDLSPDHTRQDDTLMLIDKERVLFIAAEGRGHSREVNINHSRHSSHNTKTTKTGIAAFTAWKYENKSIIRQIIIKVRHI